MIKNKVIISKPVIFDRGEELEKVVVFHKKSD